MEDKELFKQAIEEGLSNRITRSIAMSIIKELAPEHIEEFSRAVEGEQDEDFYAS